VKVVPERLDPLAALETEVGVLVRRARRVIAERAQSVDPTLAGVSYLLLGYVSRLGPLRASELGAAFHMDKAGVSRQVQQLIDLGLLDRHPDPDDGRATLLSISEEGRRRMQAVAAARREWLAQRLGEWDHDELAAFVVNLSRYNAALAHERDC